MANEYNKMINQQQFMISDDINKIQVERVHRFLSNDSYWAAGIPFEVVKKSIDHSLNFGVYDPENNQVGYARVITDQATFAYLCDVYVEESYRGLGLSKWLIQIIMNHSDLQNLRRFLLATVGTHDLYRQFGFEVTKTPERWMEIKNPDTYKNWNSN